MKKISCVLSLCLLTHGLIAANNLPPSVQFGANLSTIKVTGASPGFLYVIEASEDLNNWNPVTPVIDVRDRNFLVAPVPRAGAYRFFRYVEFFPEAVVGLSPASPEFKLVSGGTTGVTSSIFKFRMSGEEGFLESLGLRLSSGSGQSIVYASVWDGPEKVGETVFTGSRRTALATLTREVFLPNKQDKSVTVKIDLACVGAACAGIPGDIIRIDHNDRSDPLFQTRIIGKSSGRTVSVTGVTVSAGVELVKSFPVFSPDPMTETGGSDGRILRYKVTADSRGPVSMAKFTLFITTSNCEVNRMSLSAFTDPAYSQPVSGFGSGGELDSKDIEVSPTALVPFYCRRLDGTKAAITVPASATYYFEVRGPVIPIRSQYILVASLLWDNELPSRPLLNVGVLEDQSKNLIWSPNSYGLSSLKDADWTDGYAVPGISVGRILQFRTN